MSPHVGAESTPPDVRGAIARSRSRYKPRRPNLAFAKPPSPLRKPSEAVEPNGRQGRTRPIDPHVTDSQRPRTVHTSADQLGRRRWDGDHSRGDTTAPPTSDFKAQPTEVAPPRHSRQTNDGHAINLPGGRAKDLGAPVVVEKLSPELSTPPLDYNRTFRQDAAPPPDQFCPPLPTPREGSHPKERRGSSSRATGDSAASTKPSAFPRRGFTHSVRERISATRLSKDRNALKKTISAPIAIESPEVATEPAFDAPVSAVNAGERRVRVKYDASLLSLPVIPSTTPIDIVRAAASHLSISIDPNSTVLLESFKQLGLERPLRRYEHVRDVMNSWDNDTQNILIIAPSPTGGRDNDLDLRFVSKAQPGDTSAYIYISQKPGSWDKRLVTLRADGQVLMAKKKSGESTNICHISDFDIYIPTERQLSKKIKPPKKLCFAVKSQQKSSMFLSATNFVHFFSTNDKALATAWYKAIQEWRSWYLVNVMGEGQKTPPDLDTGTANSARKSTSEAPSRPSMASERGRMLQHRGPLVASDPERDEDNQAEAIVPRRLPTRSRGPPPVSFPKKLIKDESNGASPIRNSGPSLIQTPSPQSAPEPFATSGLLGRTYSQRQRSQQQREANQIEAQQFQPTTNFNGGTGASLKRSSSQRTSSHRPQPKPLVDLTPQYQEPPQHRKGRGVHPDHIPPGGLVEVATSPEQAISIPPATTWQRPTAGYSGHEVPHRTRTMRSVRRSNSTKRTSNSPTKNDLPFTGGLLAQKSERSQGGTGTGHGVRTGDREAKEPLLDMREPGRYAPGSLLDRVERYDPTPASAVIDRERKREVDVSVGEGV